MRVRAFYWGSRSERTGVEEGYCVLSVSKSERTMAEEVVRPPVEIGVNDVAGSCAFSSCRNRGERTLQRDRASSWGRENDGGGGAIPPPGIEMVVNEGGKRKIRVNGVAGGIVPSSWDRNRGEREWRGDYACSPCWNWCKRG